MIAVYTALFGPYDTVPPATFGGVLFTDQRPVTRGWEIRYIDPPHPDPRYASRWYFSQSHKALPDARYTVMHGANGQMQVDPVELARLLPPDVDIGVWRHAHRESVYDEARACIAAHKDKPDIIKAQMDRYLSEGFVGDELSTCIIVVRRNTPSLAEFESFWWSEIENGSCRDQLSFDYTSWKTGIPVHHFDEQLKRGHVLKVRKHVR